LKNQAFGGLNMHLSEYFADLTRVYVLGCFLISAGVLCCG